MPILAGMLSVLLIGVATAVPDTNVVLNLFTVVALAVFAVPVLRSRRKDGVISQLEKVAESSRLRIQQLEEDLKSKDVLAEGLAKERQECEREIVKWKARYEEQSRYTAREALEDVEKQMAAQERTMRTAVEALGNLIEKNSEVTARLVGAIEGQGVRWTSGQSPSSRRED